MCSSREKKELTKSTETCCNKSCSGAADTCDAAASLAFAYWIAGVVSPSRLARQV